jgi:hypothetical protein
MVTQGNTEAAVDIPIDGDTNQTPAAVQEQTAIRHSNLLAKIGLGCLPIFWLVLCLYNISALLWPFVFLPTIIFLIIWKARKRDEVIGFWALCSAYMKGFFIGIPVQIFQFLFLLLVVMFIMMANSDDGFIASFVIFMVIYSIFGVGWSSEYAKFYIARKARSDRPEMTDVHAFLWYSLAGALGLTTFNVSVATFVNYFYLPLDAGLIIVVLIIVILLQVPSELLTGYIIGVGIAKNEVFRWNMSGFKIWGIPMLIRSLGAIIFWVVFLALDGIAAIVSYVVLIIATCVFVWFQNKGILIPSSLFRLKKMRWLLLIQLLRNHILFRTKFRFSES